ncbi:ATP-dependent Clp protease proteolytic subunit [Candidatus Roizmanbacteria bacterium]|nr:ATP-dependent Clp protease proteolytic subunit [Candidatus Roizmanbacteria bacterium]
MKSPAKTPQRIFYSRLIGGITDETVREVVKDIDTANTDKKIHRIVLTVASNGGQLYPAFALYDHIRASKKPVDIVAAGYCMSAAVMILQAGRKRLSYPHTVFMVHPSAYKLDERRSYREFMMMVDSYKKEHDLFVELTIERSGMTKIEFEKIYEPRKYLTPEEAKKLGKHGLIDEIVKL